MDRRTLTVLVVAALAALAIGVAAATLSSTVEPEDDESGGGVPTEEEPPGEGSSGASGTPAFVNLLMSVMGVVATLGVVAYVILYPRKGGAAAAALLILVLVIIFVWHFGGIQPDPSEPLELPEEGQNESQNASQDGGAGFPVSVSPALVGAVLTVLMLGVLFVLRRSDDGADVDETDETETEADDTAALGAIAGRTADRIEDDTEPGANAENEVYRAWREMTAQFDIENEETTTPREFQARAVDAGIDPDDVRELTALFEAVRYGGEAATEDREQRALTVLRRIESKYGEENA